MKELWIGRVEVLTEPAPGSGNTMAFTNVVTWAEVEDDYVRSVNEVFSGHGWTVLNSENVRPIAREDRFTDEMKEMIERAKADPRACLFGSFHYYPSRPA